MPLRVIEYCGIINKWPGCTHTLVLCLCAWVIIPAINGIIIQRRIYATIQRKLSAYLSEFVRLCVLCVCVGCVCGVCGLGN